MARSLGLLLGLACLLIAAQTVSAGFCFPSLVDLLANKFEKDGQTVFTVTRQDGAPLNLLKPALCPGMTYNVHIEFPDPRTYFVMGTKGFFKGLLPSISCPNQMTNNQSSQVTSIDLPFTVACDVKGLSVWGIASLPKAALLYKFLNVSMPVLGFESCPTSFCLKNNTGNYTGSLTGNSTIPAYGQCGGAGGECANYNFCADATFPGFKCISGWTCQRQHRWYYQCLPPTSTAISTAGCDFSVFGEPLATMMSGLGMICNLKAGIMQFALNPLAMPKLIDPFAMLNVFSGLAVLKKSAMSYDPLTLITCFKQLTDMVPTGNSTQAVMVAGMSKFLTVMTTKVIVAGGNSTDLSKAALDVLAAMGGAAYAGSYTDLTKTFSLSSMMSVVSSFGTMMTLVKNLNLQF